MSERAPLVCVIEDDADLRLLVERWLTGAGYRCACAPDPEEGQALVDRKRPDLVLLDVMMPKTNGFDFCAALQQRDGFSAPVVFMTALSGERDKAKAFSVGAADYLVKPLAQKTLLEAVRRHLGARERWAGLAGAAAAPGARDPGELARFREAVLRRAGGGGVLAADAPLDAIYAAAPGLGLTRERVARLAAEQLGLEFRPRIDPESISLGVLPAKFATAHRVVAISEGGATAFVLANPFSPETRELLRRHFGEGSPRLYVADPRVVDGVIERRKREQTAKLVRAGAAGLPASEIGDHMLEAAVFERASDVHVEPKESGAVVRFRIDGDLREMFTLKSETSLQVISRLKTMANMDVAERRRPQDGAMETVLDGRPFVVRLATTSTPDGESLVLRLLEPWAKPKSLAELGMMPRQVEDMHGFARRNQGLVLIAGPTGSGKTTTIYSLLRQIDCETRSLITIEDPVEYRIPAANQQQVDEKAGVTFETLLKSAVRQDPDILFLGEMRDANSSKMAVDFASTGHLTVSTVHTTNAITAIFRLERIGITRGAMADCILGVIAQKLVKRLCAHCKKEGPITEEEARMLESFTERVPERVARPEGCDQCGGTGYRGREGVYEIVKFYPEISEMIRRGAPIPQIRDFSRDRGDYLVGQHAVEKVRELLCDPKMIYDSVLLEEAEYRRTLPRARRPADPEPAAAPEPQARPEPKPDPAPAPPPKSGGAILVVEDDADTRVLIERLLANAGYSVTTAADGVEALLHLGKADFDLILSDIEMPNLDGLKLMEMKQLKGIAAPVILLSARSEPEDELKGLGLGAEDYIRKPVAKQVLLMRVQRLLGRRG